MPSISSARISEYQLAAMKSNSVRFMDGHIPESWIFRSVDKEITADDSEWIEEHLRDCPACRSVAQRYKATLDQLSRYKRVIVDPGLSLSHSHQLVFEDKLDRLAGALQSRRRFRLPNLSVLWRFISGRVALHAAAFACAALAAIACLVIFRTSVPAVSAKELLIRSTAFEDNSTRGISAPVIVQKIRITAGTHVAERTLYRDMWNKRRAHEIDGSSEEDRFIDETLQRASLNADELLIPATFLRISGENKASALSVKSIEGPMLLMLHQPGRLVTDVELTLRDKDFHAIGSLLHLREQPPIQIVELSYRVVSLGTLRAGLFDSLRTEKGSELAINSHLNLISDPASVEIAALSSLHKIHAELGGEISIDDSDSRFVKVEGVVENDARKQEIDRALRRFSPVQSHIETFAQKRRSLQPQIYENQGTVTATSAAPLLDKQLRERFPSPEERQEYVRSVLSYGQSSSSYAWVLNELSRRFTPARCSSLSPRERKELNHLLADETDSLSEDLAGLKRQADTILSVELPMTAGTSDMLLDSHEQMRGQEESGGWQDRLHAIHSALDRVNDNLTTLIVGADRRKISSDHLRSETYQLLVSLTIETQRFRSSLSRR